jgi:succinate dehydrogenase / fumarate reductase iron-sulfur subunit
MILPVKYDELVMKRITFRILRFKPGWIDPPRFQSFRLEVTPGMTILEGLEKIRLEQDKTLMYSHSCHHSSCGTCAIKINGQERLACITKLTDLAAHKVELAPLDGFKPLGDLVVDKKQFFEDFSQDWTYLREAEALNSTRLPRGIRQFARFENCIECGACVAACPVTRKNPQFLGPAVLAAVHNELEKFPGKKNDLLTLAGSKRGVQLCERALNCSRVCPTDVYPAMRIENLRKLLKT